MKNLLIELAFIFLWSFFVLTVSGYFYSLNLQKLLLPRKFIDSIELIKRKSGNSIPTYIADSMRVAHQIPLEIYLMAALLKYCYLIFFVLSSYAASSVINSGFFEATEYQPPAGPIALLIGVNSFWLIYKFKATFYVKMIMSVIAVIFSFYIMKQNGFLAFYWLTNSTVFPLLIYFERRYAKSLRKSND